MLDRELCEFGAVEFYEWGFYGEYMLLVFFFIIIGYIDLIILRIKRPTRIHLACIS